MGVDIRSSSSAPSMQEFADIDNHNVSGHNTDNLTNIMSSIVGHVRGIAKHRHSRDSTLSRASSNRQWGSSSSLGTPVSKTRSSTVDTAATTPWSMSAELANGHDQQLCNMPMQLFDAADALCQEEWIRDLPISQINEWMEYEGPLDDNNITEDNFGGRMPSEERTTNITDYNAQGERLPAVSQSQFDSASERSTNHSPTSTVPYPSIERSQSSVDTQGYKDIVSRIHSQLLDFQEDPDWNALPGRFRARLTLLLNICSPQKIKSPPGPPKSTAKRTATDAALNMTRLNRTESWYSRFLSIEPAHLLMPEALRLYLDRPPNSFLNPPSVSKVCQLGLQDTAPDSHTSILAKRILYMRTLRVSTTHHLILTNLNCLSLFLLSHGSLAQWKSKAADKRAQKLWRDQLPSIFEMLHPRLPPATAADAYAAFEKEVRGWQRTGSLLAHLAKEIGLGAIVLLHEKLENLNGASRGLERISGASVFGKKRPSEVAFGHLRSIGIVQAGVRTGATAFVQGVVRELLRSFEGWEGLEREAGLPGFDGN